MRRRDSSSLQPLGPDADEGHRRAPLGPGGHERDDLAQGPPAEHVHDRRPSHEHRAVGAPVGPPRGARSSATPGSSGRTAPPAPCAGGRGTRRTPRRAGRNARGDARSPAASPRRRCCPSRKSRTVPPASCVAPIAAGGRRPGGTRPRVPWHARTVVTTGTPASRHARTSAASPRTPSHLATSGNIEPHVAATRRTWSSFGADISVSMSSDTGLGIILVLASAIGVPHPAIRQML